MGGKTVVKEGHGVGDEVDARFASFFLEVATVGVAFEVVESCHGLSDVAVEFGAGEVFVYETEHHG